MSDDLFTRLGGHDTFARLVRGFYARVPDDPVLAPLYPLDDLDGAEERLRLFLIQRFGGPTTYSDERGHPRLRMRHAPFVIGAQERDAWLDAMLASLDDLALDPDVDALVREYLVTSAHSLVNHVDAPPGT